jgi:hypothetical protein
VPLTDPRGIPRRIAQIAADRCRPPSGRRFLTMARVLGYLDIKEYTDDRDGKFRIARHGFPTTNPRIP